MGDTIVDVFMGPVYVESALRHHPHHALFSPADASSTSLFAKREGPLPPGRILKPGRCYHLVRKAQGKSGITGGEDSAAHSDDGGTAGRKPPRDLRKTPSANGRNERQSSPPSAYPTSGVPPLAHVPARSPPRGTIFAKPRHRVNHSTSALPDVSPDVSPPPARGAAAFPAVAHAPAHEDGGAGRRAGEAAGETGGTAPNWKAGDTRAGDGQRGGLAASPGRLMVPALRRSRRGMHRPCRSLSGSPGEIEGLAAGEWGEEEGRGKAGDGRWSSAHVTPQHSAHTTPYVSPLGSAHASPMRGSLLNSCGRAEEKQHKPLHAAHLLQGDAAAQHSASPLKPRHPGREEGGAKGAGAQAGVGVVEAAGSSPLRRSHGRRHSTSDAVGAVGALEAVEALIGAQRVLSMAEGTRGRGRAEGEGGEMGEQGKAQRGEGGQGWAEALVEKMRQLSPLRGRSPLKGRSPLRGRSPKSQRVHAAEDSHGRSSMGVRQEGERSPDLARPPSAVPRRSSLSPPRVIPDSSLSPPRPPMLHPPTPVLFATKPTFTPCQPIPRHIDAQPRMAQASPPVRHGMRGGENNPEVSWDVGREEERQELQGQEEEEQQQQQQRGGREEARKELKRKECDKAKETSGRERSPLRRLLSAMSLDSGAHAGRPRRAMDDSMVGRKAKGRAAEARASGAAEALAAGAEASATGDLECRAALQAFRRRVEVLNGECLFNWSTATAGKEERRASMWKPDLPDVQEACDAGSFAAPITRHKRTLSAQITSWLI
ncbi:hypothetical protein CLOP_g22879 [Closterium sp. NIES-67]|nr:hypothetical protein CLOP_g22879 [Closterium sp. NIES-67]